MKSHILKAFVAVSALAGVAAVITACSTPGTQAGQSTPRQCLIGPMNTTNVIDDKTLFISDNRGQGALVHMKGSCLSKFEPVGFKFRGSSDICAPIDADITGSLSSIPTPCFVDSIEFLTKEQTAAQERGKATK